MRLEVKRKHTHTQSRRRNLECYCQNILQLPKPSDNSVVFLVTPQQVLLSFVVIFLRQVLRAKLDFEQNCLLRTNLEMEAPDIQFNFIVCMMCEYWRSGLSFHHGFQRQNSGNQALQLSKCFYPVSHFTNPGHLISLAVLLWNHKSLFLFFFLLVCATDKVNLRKDGQQNGALKMSSFSCQGWFLFPEFL